MLVLSFFQWCNQLAIAAWIRGSVVAFPIVEAIHLLALAMIGGAVLLVDLRLLGFGIGEQSPSETAANAEPWLIGSLSVMLMSGFLLFASEAIKCYNNLAFWLKMVFLFLAVAFTFSIRRKVAMGNSYQTSSLATRLVAVTSISLWSGVGLMGRGIGFN
jgi:hypothetical protein